MNFSVLSRQIGKFGKALASLEATATEMRRTQTWVRPEILDPFLDSCRAWLTELMAGDIYQLDAPRRLDEFLTNAFNEVFKAIAFGDFGKSDFKGPAPCQSLELLLTSFTIPEFVEASLLDAFLQGGWISPETVDKSAAALYVNSPARVAIPSLQIEWPEGASLMFVRLIKETIAALDVCNAIHRPVIECALKETCNIDVGELNEVLALLQFSVDQGLGWNTAMQDCSRIHDELTQAALRFEEMKNIKECVAGFLGDGPPTGLLEAQRRMQHFVAHIIEAYASDFSKASFRLVAKTHRLLFSGEIQVSLDPQAKLSAQLPSGIAEHSLALDELGNIASAQIERLLPYHVEMSFFRVTQEAFAAVLQRTLTVFNNGMVPYELNATRQTLLKLLRLVIFMHVDNYYEGDDDEGENPLLLHHILCDLERNSEALQMAEHFLHNAIADTSSESVVALARVYAKLAHMELPFGASHVRSVFDLATLSGFTIDRTRYGHVLRLAVQHKLKPTEIERKKITKCLKDLLETLLRIRSFLPSTLSEYSERHLSQLKKATQYSPSNELIEWLVRHRNLIFGAFHYFIREIYPEGAPVLGQLQDFCSAAAEAPTANNRNSDGEVARPVKRSLLSYFCCGSA